MKNQSIYQDDPKQSIRLKVSFLTSYRLNIIINNLRNEFPDNEQELDDYYVFLEEISYTQAKNAYIKAFNRRLEEKGLLK